MKYIGSQIIETKRLILKPQTMLEQKRLWEILMLPEVNKYFLTIPSKFKEKLLDWNNQEEYYQQVKTLIREKPGMTFKDIIAQTGVPERLMRRWLQDGRLEVNTKESFGLKCERCRKEILQGKYCVDCRQIMQNGLNDLMNESKKLKFEQDSNKKKGSGMRFIND